jgi:3-oxoacyl-[acyl-carrier protein] reductase
MKAKLVGSHMGEGASVVNIGSAASRLNTPNGSIYTATKAAADSLTRVLAKELGPKRIRVNAVSPGFSPGFTCTEGTSGYMGSDLANTFVANTSLGRVGELSDIAGVVIFLLQTTPVGSRAKFCLRAAASRAVDR